MQKIFCDICKTEINEINTEDGERRRLVIEGDSLDHYISVTLETDNDLCRFCIRKVVGGEIVLEHKEPSNVTTGEMGRSKSLDLDNMRFFPDENLTREAKINFFVRQLDNLKSLERKLRDELNKLN